MMCSHPEYFHRGNCWRGGKVPIRGALYGPIWMERLALGASLSEARTQVQGVVDQGPWPWMDLEGNAGQHNRGLNEKPRD